MHECLTQALTRTVAGFTKSRLIFFRASFTYKLCDTNSSDLSVWSSFAPFCICTTVPNGLPVLAFADSNRSQPLQIRSAHIASGFQMIPNHYLIRRDAFSANLTIVHGIGCSLNLNIDLILIIVLLFFGSMGLVWVWFAEYGQAIDWQTLPHVWPPAATKSPNFWAGPK